VEQVWADAIRFCCIGLSLDEAHPFEENKGRLRLGGV